MKATDIYRQDSLVFVLFGDENKLIISAPNRQAARDIESSLVDILDYLDDVSIVGRFT